jgi:hypothetical protein
MGSYSELLNNLLCVGMMKRIHEIIGDLRHRYPRDDFFSSFEESCRISPEKRYYYCLYNKALMVLDDESWAILKDKALQHYLDHRKGQKKQGFFNQLNEAFAYRYLVRKGFDGVRLIEEGARTSPDIRLTVHNIQSYCEVKTLGISEDEINRRSSHNVIDGAVYASLSDGFLKKFADAVGTARKQIQAWGSNGLVYVIIRFDDIALDYYQDYRKQLIRFARNQGFENLFIKIGLRGNKSILHNVVPPDRR